MRFLTPDVIFIFFSLSSCIMASASSAIISRSAMSMSSGGRLIYSYSELRKGTLVRRYKRFLADVDFETAVTSSAPPPSASVKTPTNVDADCESKADVTVVHCPNTGSMHKLIPPDNMSPECACSTAPDGTKRKYRNTLEMIKQNDAWVGVHSALANKMVESALNSNLIEGCMDFDLLQREVKVTLPSGEKAKGSKGKAAKESEESRIDFKLSWNVDPFRAIEKAELKVESKLKSRRLNVGVEDVASSAMELDVGGDGKDQDGGCTMLLEVKSVTLAMKSAVEGAWSAQFPDSVSTRGQKHLRCLTEHVRRGGRAGILFLIQRDDCSSFSACHLDPAYGPLLHEASVAGVLIIPYHCRLDPLTATVQLLGRLPFVDTYADSTDSIEKDPKVENSVTKKKVKKVKLEDNISSIMDMTTDMESNVLIEITHQPDSVALGSSEVAALLKQILRTKRKK